MAAFDFEPRTRTVFGPGSLERLGGLAAALGGRRALVVSDPGIVAAGYPKRALDLLAAAGLEASLYDGVEENPTTANVEAGAAVAAERGVDLLIGLGGGSSIDCAKGVNFVVSNGGRMKDYWGAGKAAKPMLPLVAVPTTAGTGSESQSFALISDAETHVKMACGDPKAAPAVALLDPDLTASQPELVAANTGIDAVTHAVETWVTRKRNAVSDLFAREAWRLLSERFPRAMADRGDQEARGAMLLGAHWAGAAIENSMLGAAHACANPLTARFGVTHGTAVGVMLPAVIRFNAPAVGDRYAELEPAGAEALAARIERFLEQARLPRRLSECGVAEAALPDLARDAADQWTAQFNPREVREPDLLELYRCAF